MPEAFRRGTVGIVDGGTTAKGAWDSMYVYTYIHMYCMSVSICSCHT